MNSGLKSCPGVFKRTKTRTEVKKKKIMFKMVYMYVSILNDLPKFEC